MTKISIFSEPLLKRLFRRFLLLGFTPTILLLIIPTVVMLTNDTEELGQPLLVIWAIQGVAFVVVLFVGARETLKLLIIPIQELITGANAIADGDLTYRVPLLRGNDELVLLSQTFNTMAASVEAMRDNNEKQRNALQESLEKRDQEFAAMLEIAGLVNQPVDLAETAERALKIAHLVLGSDMFALALLDEESQLAATVFACKDCAGNTLEHCGACERQPLLHKALHQMKDNVGTCIETKEHLMIPDTVETKDLSPQALATLAQLKIRKLFIKPLLARGRVLGVLFFLRHNIEKIPGESIMLSKALSENITVLLENRQLQTKARELTVMEERRRLASELHDSVTQSLFTLSLTAQGLKSQLNNAPGINHQALDMLVNQTKVIQVEMRTLVNELRPIELGANDLESALRQHVQSVRYSTNTQIKLAFQGNIRRLPQPVQQHINRIAQEALSNIARHASATNAEIRLGVDGRTATLMIADDGIGFDPQAVAVRQSESLGLISMRERVELLRGALMVRSQPGAGTILTAQIPLFEDSEIVNVAG